ncbi:MULTISPECIES: hypothetical protein [unclassified Pseudoalteromonas]|uniref:hypothetical protein n=1 Tax=unclassified Pseudoalteromonas TaxID=194690 RepID=UPI001EF6DE49|nr:hypothetical protein [Pseudoalteromonas sp. Of11M-6]MCG7552561.1 hypothetical protein [Pseudoalteromonas sp. Of11M-6]
MDDSTSLMLPKWAIIACKLPKPFWTIVSHIVGSYWFFDSLFIKKGTPKSLEAMRILLGLRSLKAFKGYWSLQVNDAKNVVLNCFLHEKDIEQLKVWSQNNIRYNKYENFLDADNRNKPIILLLNSFTVHYLGLLKNSNIDRKIKVVQPKLALDILNKVGFYEKLSIVSGNSISGIEADSKRVGIQLVKSLKKNEILAMRVDSLPTQTNRFVFSNISNQKSVFPLSILELAAKFNATILPFHIFLQDDKYVTEFGKPVYLDNKLKNEDYGVISKKLDFEMFNKVSELPYKYSGWAGLLDKIRLAQSLEVEVIKNDI